MKRKHSSGQPGRAGRRAAWLAAVALVVSALAVAAGAAVASPEKKSALPSVVNIGVLDSITGPAGFCGVEEQQGIGLAVKEAKRMKFLGKTQIALKLVDDRSNVDAGVAGVNQLIDQNVAAVIGPCSGAVANVTIPLTERANMPHVITTATAADPGPEHVFRAGIPQTRYAFQVIKLLKGRKVARIAFFYDSSVPTNRDVWRTQRIAARNLKMEVVEEEGAPIATSGISDFTSQVAKLIRARPDAVGLLLQGAPNLTVTRQLRQAGYRGAIFGSQGMLAPFYMTAGDDVKGVLVSVSFAPGLGPASSKNFAKKFQQRYGRPPTELGAHGYDAAWMVIRALKQANSTDKAKLLAALKSIKRMPGAQGAIRFNAVGDAVGTGFVAEFQGNGTMKGVSK